MKKLALIIIGCCVIIIGLGIGLLLYIRPVEELGLEYKPLVIEEKVIGMIAKRKLEVTFTEDEVNSMLKKWLSENAHVSELLEITGAQGTLQGNALTMDVNANYANRIPFGAKLHYILSWEAPNLIAELQSVTVKKLDLPIKWIQTQRIILPIEQQLPPKVHINKVEFIDQHILVKLKVNLWQ